MTADELWTYLRGKVSTAARQVGIEQTPLLIGQLSHGLPLSVNAGVLRGHAALGEFVRGLIGLDEGCLSTDEARFCMQLLMTGPETDEDHVVLKMLKDSAALDKPGAGLGTIVGLAMRAAEAQHSGLPAVEPVYAPEHPGQSASQAEEQVQPAGASSSPSPEARAAELRAECSLDTAECERLILRGRGSTPHLDVVHTSRMRLWREAESMGVPEAQWLVARCMQEGLGVDKDPVEAVALLRRAAEQGYTAAQNNLGTCYAKGKGVAQDQAEAVTWYRKAAEQGYASTQLNLGYSYGNGEGVAQDQAEAARWYRKAAEQGHATARKILEERSKKGGCFISTAVAQSLRKPDDCEELQLLGAFRDTFMATSSERLQEVARYYELAPRIVEAVESSRKAYQEWARVRGTHLTPAIEAVRAGHDDRAYRIYKAMVQELEHRWLEGGYAESTAGSSRHASDSPRS